MKLSEDIDLIAGEYVLGTLEAQERRFLEVRAVSEPDLAAAIAVWQRRLAPLHQLVAPVEPPDTIWPLIADRLAEAPQDERQRDPNFLDAVAALSRGNGVASVAQLAAEARRWRAIAVLAGMLALTFAALLASGVVQSLLGRP